MREIKLSPKQSFYLWRHCGSDVPNGIMSKLFDCFGGEKSKVYKNWCKKENKKL